MAARRVFLLSSGRLTVYHFARGRVLEPLAFAADDGGLRQFSIYLDREPDVPAVMLVDLVEEEFREETVPHVWGADRRALVRNKKNRLFRDPRFSQAIFQGREREGRVAEGVGGAVGTALGVQVQQHQRRGGHRAAAGGERALHRHVDGARAQAADGEFVAGHGCVSANGGAPRRAAHG